VKEATTTFYSFISQCYITSCSAAGHYGKTPPPPWEGPLLRGIRRNSKNLFGKLNGMLYKKMSHVLYSKRKPLEKNESGKKLQQDGF
jgi:hypothetical protein